MKIEKLKVTNLRNEEWFQYFTEFKIMVEKQDPAITCIDALFATFLSLYANADSVLEKIRKNAYTAQLTDADNLRDNIFRGFREVVKGFRSHFDAEKQRAANSLMTVFEQYGNLPQKGYSAETAAIYNFVQEMRGGFAANITTLGLAEWVKNLDDTNKAFQDMMLERNDEQSQAPELRMVDVRRELDGCYAEMVTRIEATALLHPDDALAVFISGLNSNIKRYKTMLAQRVGKSKKEKEETE